METVETRFAYTGHGRETYRDGPRGPQPLKYETEQSVGFDLRAAIEEPVELRPVVFGGRPEAIPTGLVPAIPAGYELQIRPRSGLAANFGVTVANAPGTIDPDFRGEMKVLLVNLGPEAMPVRPHERIAQAVIAPAVPGSASGLTIVSPDELDETERGAGGLGHTGTS